MPLDMDATLIAVVEMSQIELARRRHRSRCRTTPSEEDCARSARLAQAVSCGGDRKPKGRVGGSGASRSLSRPATTASGWRAGLPLQGIEAARDPCLERGRDARTSPRQDRPARHGAARARLPGLAARRAGPLQDGGGADAGRGRCQASEPRARGAGRRADAALLLVSNRRLVRLGIRGFNPKLKTAPARLETLRTPSGEPIPDNTLAALEARHGAPSARQGADPRDRDDARSSGWLLRRKAGTNAMVLLLARVVGISNRDRRHAGAGGAVAASAGSTRRWRAMPV